MASTDSAARSPAPATRSTASGVPQDQAQGSEANGSGLGCRSRGGGPEGGTDVTKGRGRGLGGGGRGALGTRPPPGSAKPQAPAARRGRGAGEAGEARADPVRRRRPLPPQLPPDERGVLVSAGLGRPALQRELPAGHARARLPGALPLSPRRRMPARQRPVPVCAGLHGEARRGPGRGGGEAEGPGRPLTVPRLQGPHCASLCPPDTYGVDCNARCSCENAIACSPVDGACVCKEGNGRGLRGRVTWGRGRERRRAQGQGRAPGRGEAAGEGGAPGAAAGRWESSQATSFLKNPLCFSSTTKILLVLKGPGQKAPLGRASLALSHLEPRIGWARKGF